MNDTKKKSHPRIAVLGGDLRQLTAAEVLTEAGCPVSLYGFDTYRDKESLPLAAALEGAEAVLLPVPVLRGEFLNLPLCDDKMTPRKLSEVLGQSTTLRTVIGGKLPPSLGEEMAEKGIACFDLCEDEGFNLHNAVPTAEGALAIAMSHTPITLSDSHVAVIGYGRIGRALSERLLALGATVTVVARREKDRIEAELRGCRACDYPQLPRLTPAFDVIANTVPTVVLQEETLRQVKKSAFVIELASKPGGVDIAAALRHEVRVISALSLPGKVAPVSAGRIIARCTLRLLGEVAP